MSQEAHVEEAEQTKARQVRETAVAYVRLKRHLCCLKTPLLHLLRTPSVVYDAGHLGCMSQQQRARQFLPGLCLLWSCVPGWLPVCLCARVCMRVHTHTHTGAGLFGGSRDRVDKSDVRQRIHVAGCPRAARSSSCGHGPGRSYNNMYICIYLLNR